jgi:hypothetical protein
VPVAGSHDEKGTKAMTLVMIGVDPHKASHTAVAVDGDEVELGSMQVRSSIKQCDVLLDWVHRFPQRRWAIESATGLGYLVAQQLVAAGEDVVVTAIKRSSVRGRRRGPRRLQGVEPID